MNTRLLIFSVVLCGFSVACDDSGDDGGATDVAVVFDDVANDAGEANDVGIAEPDLGEADGKPTSPDVKLDVSAGPCGLDCPDGYCNETDFACEYCEVNGDCGGHGLWCRDHRCVWTPCIPGSTGCEDETTQKVCDESGENWEVEPCGDGEGCAGGACAPQVCAPGETRCDGVALETCMPHGLFWARTACAPGTICLSDECQAIKSNLLVIFDTSGSMGFDVDCICPGGCFSEPFPVCETGECPQTVMGMAKKAFRSLLSNSKLDQINMVLTHFPLGTDHLAGSCQEGFYHTLGGEMTGEDGSHETVEGGWFDTSLAEILAVSFPKTRAEDTLAVARSWFDNNEEIAPEVGQSCTTDDDCPGGHCHSFQGNEVCWYHSNPEMRAEGGTPLGRSLFYAGELFRRYIFVEGKTCDVDADCENVNYVCREGACHDPVGHCRSNMIIMVTDGEGNGEQDDFFEPWVQAKRMRYGLACESDNDCFDGSTCLVAEGYCGGYDQPYAADSPLPNYVDEGPHRLLRYDGAPLMVTTHVVDVSIGSSGQETNRIVADNGGGQYHTVTEADAEALLAPVLEIIDIKDGIICEPVY